jgi:hypothetical protein
MSMTIHPPSGSRRRAAALALTACAALWVAAFLKAQAQAEAPQPVPSGSDLQACRDACQALTSRLMNALQASLREGGPTAAIAICRDQAPKLASEVSTEKACTVRRTSLKARNPKNAPDAWERKVLESFATLASQGKSPAGVEFSVVVREGGQPVLRYMRGIAVGAPCLTCHGRALTPEVSAAIQSAYPEDRATGYGDGDLRGAFSVRRPLSSTP